MIVKIYKFHWRHGGTIIAGPRYLEKRHIRNVMDNFVKYRLILRK